MAGEWPTVRIEDIAEKVAMGPFGSNIKVETFVAKGVPVISGTHLRNVRLEDGNFNFVTAEHAEKMKNSNVFRGDVIFTHAGNIGQVAYIPPDSQYERYVISQRQFYLRCDLSKADPAFVSYFFHSHEGQHKLLANASQTGVPSIARPSSYLKTIEFSLPPLPEQRAIAHILGTLDDKIELNRRRNQTLEAMARALFKDWFVDFGPVRAKMEAREPYLPADLWQPFPDRLDDEGKPEGWVVGSVEDLCSSITSGGTPARKKSLFWDGGTIPWFKTGELQDGPLLDSEEKITETALHESSCKLWPAGTILFALYASPTVGRLGVLTSPATSNQAAAGLIAKESIGVPFLRRALLEARERLQNIAVGAAQQNINQAILKTHRLVMPPACMGAHYSKLVRRWDDQQVQLACETRTLAQLRDTLLPKLISGELRIPDAERFLESLP